MSRMDGGFIEKTVAQILYVLNDSERNAYIASIIGEIRNHFSEIDNTEEATSQLYISPTWQSVIVPIKNNIEDILEEHDPQMQQEWLKAFQTHYEGQKFTTFNQLRKWLSAKWDKAWKQMISQISKNIFELYQNNPKELKLKEVAFYYGA